MSIIQGNDRILFVKVGDIFQPIACLSSNGMDEDVEMLSTTTRNSEGWRTSLPTQQGFSVNFTGFQIRTLFLSNVQNLVQTKFILTFLNNTDDFIKFRIEYQGVFYFYNKTITTDTGLIAANPFFYILRGATITETVFNFAVNLNTYNAEIATFEANGNSLNVIMNDLTATYEILVPNTTPISYVVITTNANPPETPNDLVSYDRLRQFKRERRFLTFRIMNTEPLPQFIDEFDGYITQISEISPVNEDATFEGTITGWGVPRLIINDIGLATGDDFVEDGNDNIIEP
ncbi:hypothetical protein [Sulfuricurvum sp. MLSB]|uniref:hypothetical protein n=1 Tax=Sulfuricurvum sp. MLSB TaxID=1537917 RepID=UPI000A7D5AF6|nr:hypothetical protein [Sulfuricurvum sp. MLSB]